MFEAWPDHDTHWRFAVIVVPLQLFIGDQHGLNKLEHQPLKIAAMEAHWGWRPSG
jgi:cytochrome d ubiquinol oxidase subunit I